MLLKPAKFSSIQSEFARISSFERKMKARKGTWELTLVKEREQMRKMMAGAGALHFER